MDAFSGVGNGGALFVLSGERFDALQIDLENSSATHRWCNGTLTAWYVSAVDTDRRRAKKWSMLGAPVKVSNTTVEPIRLRWSVPTDWNIATLNDGTLAYNGGQVFGRVDLLDESGLVFAVKLQWASDEALGCNAPLVNDVTHRRWIAPVHNASSTYPPRQNATFGRGFKNSPFMIVRMPASTIGWFSVSAKGARKETGHQPVWWLRCFFFFLLTFHHSCFAHADSGLESRE